jgi:hypothetical protein
MARTHLVVSVCDHEHGVCTINSPSEELEEVQGRLIGPMHILKYDEGRRTALQFIQSGVEDNFAGSAGIDGFEQDPHSLARYVVQGREGPRRKKRIAGAPQNPPRLLPSRELLNESRLADPSLAMHQRNASPSCGGEQPLLEVDQTPLAFQQCRRNESGICNGLHRQFLPRTWHHAGLGD